MIVVGILALLALVVWIAKPIKNEFGTFGDDDYDYDGELRARGWDKPIRSEGDPDE